MNSAENILRVESIRREARERHRQGRRISEQSAKADSEKECNGCIHIESSIQCETCTDYNNRRASSKQSAESDYNIGYADGFCKGIEKGNSEAVELLKRWYKSGSRNFDLVHDTFKFLDKPSASAKEGKECSDKFSTELPSW